MADTDQNEIEVREPGSPSSPVPWTAGDVWLGLGAFGLWMLAALGFGIGWELYSWNIDPGLFIAVWELALVLPAWWFSVHKYGQNWEILGLRKFDLSSVAIGCGLMVIVSCFNFFYNFAASTLDLSSPTSTVDIFESVTTPWPLLAAGVIVAPIVEEIFFRGFVFAGFRDRFGWVAAALISAGFFAVFHLQPISLLPIFLMGLVFAYLYHRTNSIWPAVIMHLATNALGLGAAYLISQLDLPLA